MAPSATRRGCRRTVARVAPTQKAAVVRQVGGSVGRSCRGWTSLAVDGRWVGAVNVNSLHDIVTISSMVGAFTVLCLFKYAGQRWR